MEQQQSQKASGDEQLWMWMSVGLGAAALISLGFWGRSKKGLSTPSVKEVLGSCKHIVSMVDETLNALETPVQHAQQMIE